MRHAHLAKQLYKACGGVDEIISADPPICRVGRTQLYEYRDRHSGAFMPADVMADLEAYCGEPVYSRALFENRPAAVHAKAFMVEAEETTEQAAALQRLVRMAAADGVITPAERAELEPHLTALEQQLRELRAAGDGAMA